jgi:hypothetical protein
MYPGFVAPRKHISFRICGFIEITAIHMKFTIVDPMNRVRPIEVDQTDKSGLNITPGHTLH